MDKKERFNAAFNYLKWKGIVTKQEDVGLAMGASRANISSALSGNPKVLTENFLVRFAHAYDMFSLEWLLSGKGEMLLNKEEQFQESSIVDLYAKLIKEHEAMRQQTKDALDEINKLKKQYEDSVIMLKDVTSQLQSLMKHVPRIYPTLEEQNPSLAADNQAPCLDIRQKVNEK